MNSNYSGHLLSTTKSDIANFIATRNCNAGGKHAYFRVLRAFYRWAVLEELTSTNPVNNLKAPKVPKPIRYFVTLDKLKTLYSFCEDDRERLVIYLLADTGVRLSELAQIDLQHIDMENRTISVWGKGASERMVTFGYATQQIIEKYISRFQPEGSLLELKSRGVSELLRRLGERSGIKCNAHSFRRTFATEAVRNGMNVFHVQSLLGHSSLTMTRIYAEQVSSQDAIKSYKPIVR